MGERTVGERTVGETTVAGTGRKWRERTVGESTVERTGNLVEKRLPPSMCADIEELYIRILHLTALLLHLIDVGDLQLLVVLHLLVAGPLARVVPLQVHGDRSRP